MIVGIQGKKEEEEEQERGGQTCSGVKATLDAVPATCFFTVVLPPHVWFCLLSFC